jgi:hypothetical protein
MMETTNDTYAELLEIAGPKLAPIVELWHLSTNYWASPPYVKFLDLIGYTTEHFGTTLYETGPNAKLGHTELDYIADALKCWAVRPVDAEALIDTIERMAD